MENAGEGDLGGGTGIGEFERDVLVTDIDGVGVKRRLMKKKVATKNPHTKPYSNAVGASVATRSCWLSSSFKEERMTTGYSALRLPNLTESFLCGGKGFNDSFVSLCF